MYEFLEKLKPTYCDNCNIDYCDGKKYYCEADLINAYKQCRADERVRVIDEVINEIKSTYSSLKNELPKEYNTLCSTLDKIAEQLKA